MSLKNPFQCQFILQMKRTQAHSHTKYSFTSPSGCSASKWAWYHKIWTHFATTWKTTDTTVATSVRHHFLWSEKSHCKLFWRLTDHVASSITTWLGRLVKRVDSPDDTATEKWMKIRDLWQANWQRHNPVGCLLILGVQVYQTWWYMQNIRVVTWCQERYQSTVMYWVAKSNITKPIPWTVWHTSLLEHINHQGLT